MLPSVCTWTRSRRHFKEGRIQVHTRSQFACGAFCPRRELSESGTRNFACFPQPGRRLVGGEGRQLPAPLKGIWGGSIRWGCGSGPRPPVPAAYRADACIPGAIRSACLGTCLVRDFLRCAARTHIAAHVCTTHSHSTHTTHTRTHPGGAHGIRAMSCRVRVPSPDNVIT